MQRRVADAYKHSPAVFANHLAQIATSPLSVSTVRDWIPGENDRKVMLTFDDGGKSALYIGDELCRRNWRGHFFVITSLMGRPCFLDESEVRYLHSCGHVIGSHSHTHPEIFRALSRPDMDEEWRVSCDRLSHLLGEACQTASVPGGDASAATYEAAREAGVRFLFNSEPRLTPERCGSTWILGRACAKRDTPAAHSGELANFRGWRRELAVRRAKTGIRMLFFPAYKMYADRVARQPATTPLRDSIPESTGNLKLSIIVPCRNEIRRIEPFMQALIHQEIDVESEVIVADGLSDDGTREILDRYAQMDQRVRIVDNVRRHTSTGLNLAIRQAQGEICIRMDVHTDYAPDYVKRSLECLQRTGADNVGGPARTRSGSTMQRTVAAAFHSFFSTGGAAFHNVEHEGYVDTVPYGCWRRAKLIDLGLFDEDLIRNEDDELNIRITQSGGRVYQSPDIRSWYYPRSNLRDLAMQYFQYGFWKAFVIHKHWKLPAWRHIVPSLFVVSNALLLTALALRTCGLDFVPDSLNLLLAINGAYLISSLIACVALATHAGWAALFLAPVVFLAFHLSYGIGFVTGWAYLIWSPNRAARSEAFTSLTR